VQNGENSDALSDDDDPPGEESNNTDGRVINVSSSSNSEHCIANSTGACSSISLILLLTFTGGICT
jgi:hypothetical protein